MNEFDNFGAIVLNRSEKVKLFKKVISNVRYINITSFVTSHHLTKRTL